MALWRGSSNTTDLAQVASKVQVSRLGCSGADLPADGVNPMVILEQHRQRRRRQPGTPLGQQRRYFGRDVLHLVLLGAVPQYLLARKRQPGEFDFVRRDEGRRARDTISGRRSIRPEVDQPAETGVR